MLELIGVVENRELTSILLDVNDNMNNQMLRFERYNNNVNGKATASGGISTEEILLEVPLGYLTVDYFYNNNTPLCLEPEPQKGAAKFIDTTNKMEYEANTELYKHLFYDFNLGNRSLGKRRETAA